MPDCTVTITPPPGRREASDLVYSSVEPKLTRKELESELVTIKQRQLREVRQPYSTADKRQEQLPHQANTGFTSRDACHSLVEVLNFFGFTSCKSPKSIGRNFP